MYFDGNFIAAHNIKMRTIRVRGHRVRLSKGFMLPRKIQRGGALSQLGTPGALANMSKNYDDTSLEKLRKSLKHLAIAKPPADKKKKRFIKL